MIDAKHEHVYVTCMHGTDLIELGFMWTRKGIFVHYAMGDI